MILLPDLKDLPVITWPIGLGALYYVGKGVYFIYKGVKAAISNARAVKAANEAKRKQEIADATANADAVATRWERTAKQLQFDLDRSEAKHKEKDEYIERVEAKCKEVSEFNFTLQGDLDNLKRQVREIEDRRNTRKNSSRG